MSSSAAVSSSLPSLPCPPERVDDFLSQPTPAVVDVLARRPGPVLVLGAGGKMGLHMCLMLRKALDRAGSKDPVTAVSRFSSLQDRSSFEQYGVATLPCDLTDAASLERLPEAPTVFFMAGVKFGTSSSPTLLKAINSDMPRSVAARFRRSRIVAYSTGCVYPFVPVTSGGATEDTPPAPVGDYAVSCLAREQAFAEAAQKFGTAVALIRLNYSVEFRYGVLVDIAQKVLSGQPVDVTMGHVNVIWQPDAIAHSILALELAGSPAVPVNVTGIETLAVRDLAQRFAKVFDRPVQIVGREEPTAWLNNAARTHQRFGAPSTSVDTMIRYIAAWLTNGGTTWGKPTGFEKRDGKF
ncbi:MAG: NAD(P)-dependent oxidoreductase [Opitutae bacterium]|nr:NAD(P)-dependent oxidoreductase [Opitutae bacterium]